MNKNTKISEIMSTNLITLHPKDNLKRAKEIFKEYHIHHIPICVMNDIRGILSLGDILYLEGMVLDSFDQFLKDKKSISTPVEDVMTRNPYCIASTENIGAAIEIMLTKRVNALPVVDNDNLVGLITTRDILSTLHENLK